MNMTDSASIRLASDLHHELTHHILPFWMERMQDWKHSGFYGRMDGRNKIHPRAIRGGILNARILWTFSAAARHLRQDPYLDVARRTREYIVTHFVDEKWGGTYWSVDYKGLPADTKKQVYSQAFFIYALSEYVMATGDTLSKEAAIRLFELIEQHSFDPVFHGYLEAFDRQWQPLSDMRLSDKDANEKKTMNTHLHILEAYTNLYRVWQDALLAKKLRSLIQLFMKRIIDPDSSHLNLFFDEQWDCKSSVVSYGHDIECSWLLLEAAGVLGDHELAEAVRQKCLQVVAAAEEGIRGDGSIVYESDRRTGLLDEDRHWWPQAEAVVGFYNAYELTGDTRYLDRAVACFRYIKGRLIDPGNGEWYWSIKANGTINRNDDKAGFWKCPYHNGRMCLEVMQRVK